MFNVILPIVLSVPIMSEPPDARIDPHVTTEHGITRVDPYAWIRQKDNPEVIELLDAENAYADAMTAHLQPLRDALYDEFLHRLVEDDTEVPWPSPDGWTYRSRTEEGKDYAIHERSKGDQWNVVLDLNALSEAGDHAFFKVTRWAVSPSGRHLAWLQDTSGYEHCTLRIRDLETGEDLPDTLEGVAAFSLAWLDDDHLCYTRIDDASRPYQAWRHKLGTEESLDALLWQEDDGRFFLSLSRLRDGAGVTIDLGSQTTSEVLFVPSDAPASQPTTVLGRRDGIEYDVDHVPGAFVVRINDTGPNFRVVELSHGGDAAMREIRGHDSEVYVTGVSAFADALVLSQRRGGYTALEVVDAASGTGRVVPLPEQVATVGLGANAVFDTPIIRLGYQSPVTPACTVDLRLADMDWHVRKQKNVPDWDASKYIVRRLELPARDGTMVPVSLIARRDLQPDSTNPMVLYGYGSYGSSMNPYFSITRPSLLDRGVVFAIAHIRGGGEMGRLWYEDGKFKQKMNTFTDFIDVRDGLVDAGWADPDHIAIEGGSAGGLLIGAVLNMRPDMCSVAHAAVPFVDVVNTMLDASIPLTVGEYEEWGNPADEDFYKYMLSYSPYDNVAPKDYPVILVTAGLNDPRVHYWEPTKWTQRLRDYTTSDNPIVQRTNMGAGHGGASGRYGRFREIAWEDAFLLDQLGLGDAITP
ncbi:MAG: S9 family peptidase [Phycisphaerales bacterium]|nr:S9 family peptidase [Phycisphaerales bacterium]